MTELRFLAQVISGQHILGADHNSSERGIGYLTGPADFGLLRPNISKWTQEPKATCEPGDILITVKGAGVGKLNYAPDSPVAIGRQLMAIRCNPQLADSGFVFLWLYTQAKYFQETAKGATVPGLSRDDLEGLKLPLLSLPEQQVISAGVQAQLVELQKARYAAESQLLEISQLADAIMIQSLETGAVTLDAIGDVLDEVKEGIGKSWKEYPVLGATRDGLAPAKEPPGKHAVKYKPAFHGTVFYNPMRIMIGSIAFVDDDDEPGITSPDYVVLRGREGVVDSRWFYYWLRSPLGVHCINSLARGAVRERMLFNRLAEGKIELPSFSAQQKASLALKELMPFRIAIQKNLEEINLLSGKVLAQAFED